MIQMIEIYKKKDKYYFLRNTDGTWYILLIDGIWRIFDIPLSYERRIRTTEYFLRPGGKIYPVILQSWFDRKKQRPILTKLLSENKSNGQTTRGPFL
jgi:hypothetical protein